MHVLIVEDQAPMRRLLREWIEADGDGVSEASTAEEGRRLASETPDLAVALCDVYLPGHDGVWLAEQMRVVSPDTSVVMSTGALDFDVAVRSLQMGAVDYVTKPFSRQRLGDALRQAFAVHTARRAVSAMQRELDVRRAQLAEALADIELNTASSVNAMLVMVHTREPRAHAAAHRIARLAVNLSLALNVREPDLSDIERAALLHNLGRIAIPDAVLARPESARSEADAAVVRSYPLHGHAMLKNVPFLAAANQIALCVHERQDGSGFPRGLSGDAIPLGARIIGVAVAYDSLVDGADRPLSRGEAIDRLANARATEFAPEVLDALRELYGAREPVASM